MTILLCLAFAISVCAEDVVFDGVTYTTSDNSSFEGYNGSATVKSATAEIVTIPDFITTDSGNKYVVNAIATGAFRGNKTVKEIRVLSDYITAIPQNFVNNTLSGALEKVFINFSNITSIGASAFNQSSNDSYGMNATTTTFDFYDAKAFKTDGSVVKVTNPDLSNLKSIGNYAMQGVKFDTLTLPSAITSLSARCFQAAKIGVLRIEGKFTTIESSAFNLSALPTAVYIDMSSVTTVKDGGFRFAGLGSANTTTQWFDLNGNAILDISNLTTIGNQAFASSNIGSATKISWPKNLSSLGEHAFRGCNMSGVAYFGADSTKSVTVSYYSLNGNNFSAIIFGEGVTKVSTSNFSSGVKLIFLADTITFSSTDSIPSNSTVYAKATSGSTQSSSVSIVEITRSELTNSGVCGVLVNLYDKASNKFTFGELNHTEGSGTPTTPSCTVPSGIEYNCSVCGAFIRYEETAPAPGHTYDENAPISVSKLTCTTDEKKTFVCSACGEEFEKITAYAPGHDHSIVSYPVVSTDGTPGIKRLTCANFDGECGDYYEYVYRISPADLSVYITFTDGTSLTVTGKDIFDFEIAVTNNVYSCILNSVKGSFEFGGKSYSRNNIQSITIPYGFTAVKPGFAPGIPVIDFTSAKDIQFSNTFQDNGTLREITLGDGAKIGGSMFRGAGNVSIIRIANNATVIFPADVNPFYDFRGLDKFIIGDGATVRFERNKTFDITMANAVRARLNEIVIGDNATVYFGYNTFNGEPNLTTITFGKNGNYTFEQYAFKGCTALKNIVIPEGSIVTIKGNAFENCTALEEIFLPSSVTSIPASAFSGCSALTSAVLMNVTSIGESAFNATSNVALTIYAHATGDLTLGSNALANRANVVLYTNSKNITSLSNATYAIYVGLAHAVTPHTEAETCFENGYIGYATDCPCGEIAYGATYTVYTNENTEGANSTLNEIIIIDEIDGHDLVITITYANGYDKNGVKCTDCSRACGAEFDDVTVKPIITHKGYSFKENGEATGIHSGFHLDVDALAEYNLYNEDLSIGLAILNPKYLGDTFFNGSKVNCEKGFLQVEVNADGYSEISCMINFPENSNLSGLELSIFAYVFEGDEAEPAQLIQKQYAVGENAPVVSTVTKGGTTLHTVNLATVMTPVALPENPKEYEIPTV